MIDQCEQTDLREVAARAARAPRLLVASDFDGTLSEIVDNPAAAQADPNAVAALRDLALLRGVTVAVISGRAVADLRSRLPYPEIAVVGGHGAEFEIDPFPRDPRLPDPLSGAAELVDSLAARLPHAFTEHKPRGVTLHFRSTVGVEDATTMVRRYASDHPEVVLREGKRVVELCRRGPDKADAYRAFRAGADTGIFLGDDATDEDVFGALSDGDVGVKVGLEESRAAYRVADVREAWKLLRYVVRARLALQEL